TTDLAKPLDNPYGRPWHLTQLQALHLVEWQDVPMLAAYDKLVPPHACVGAALGGDEPAYLLYGTRLRRRGFFLPTRTLPAGEGPVDAALHDGASYVVISTGLFPPTPPALAVVPGEFAAAGWRIHPLSGYWKLAIAPRPVTDAACDEDSSPGN